MKESKNEMVYCRIKDGIINEEIGNSTPISENILAQKLKISRTPIRAALQRLQLEGFIRIIPNQGIVVQEVTLKEAKEMYDLRLLVETYMIERSFPLLEKEDLSRMDALIAEQQGAAAHRDFKEFLRLDLAFHMLSYSRYENEKMTEIIRHYKERFTAPRLRVIQHNGRMENGLKEHGEIVKFLKEPNVPQAIEAAKQHISKGALRALTL